MRIVGWRVGRVRQRDGGRRGGGTRRGLRGERGNAIVEFCYLGILFLVPLVYIMLAVFDVQRAMYGVSAATRDAGRAYVLSANVAQAETRARQAASVAMNDQGLTQGYSFNATCQGGCLQSGSSVEITVTYVVRFPFIPDAIGGPLVSFPVSSVHRTPYGDYRQSRG
jgi:Flp pilus assembly protein TadG